MRVKDKYQNLLTKRDAYRGKEFHIKLDTENKAPIFIGLDEKSHISFFFEYEEDLFSSVDKLSDTVCYKVKVDQHPNEKSKIRLTVVDDSCSEMFYVVVDDLIDKVSSESRNVTGIIIERLQMWESFFRSAKVKGVLDIEKQIGLIGELLFIEEYIPELSSIVNFWGGPERSVKDFVFGKCAVEIKTTTINGTNRIHISDENQLDDSGFDELYLNCRIINQNQMDGRSLPEIVDDIKSGLSVEESKIFEEKLLFAGYISDLRNEYQNKYMESSSFWYRVGECNGKHFPRITPSSLPKGVKFVKYQIEMSTLEEYMVDSIIVKEMILKGN